MIDDFTTLADMLDLVPMFTFLRTSENGYLLVILDEHQGKRAEIFEAETIDELTEDLRSYIKQLTA